MFDQKNKLTYLLTLLVASANLDKTISELLNLDYVWRLEQESKENKRESGPKDEGHDYRRYWRGDSGWENRGSDNELTISRNIDNKNRII